MCGGQWAPELKFAGYDGVVVEGRASSPVFVFIDDDKVEIREGAHLWGMTTGETEKAIKEEIGDRRVSVLSAGPAGEKRVRFAGVIHESRAAARGGAGAVMGSKNLKAITVRGTGSVEVAWIFLAIKICLRKFMKQSKRTRLTRIESDMGRWEQSLWPTPWASCL